MTVLKMKVDGAWLPVGGVRETVWAGPSAPVDPEIDLWVDTDEAALIPFTAAGTAQLVRASATALQLNNGVIPLYVGGVWTTRAVNPPITVGNAGTVGGALYFIYAYDNAGATTLEAITTTPVVDAATGVSVKSGASTHTLVGAAMTGSGSTPGLFYDEPTYRMTRTWFGDSGVAAQVSAGGGEFTTSATTGVTMIMNPYALMWAYESVVWGCTSHAYHSVANGMCNLQVEIAAGTTPTTAIGGPTVGGVSAIANARVPLTAMGAGRVAATGLYYGWVRVYTWGLGSVTYAGGGFTTTTLMTGGSGR